MTRTEGEWIEELEAHRVESTFPFWENANYTPAAMRATGFGSGKKRALLFEVLADAHREDEIQRLLYAYGDVPKSGYVGSWPVIEREALVEDVDGDTMRSRVTGVTFAWQRKGSRYLGMKAIPPEGGIHRRFRVSVGGAEVEVEVAPPALGRIQIEHAGLLRRLSPTEAVLFRIVQQVDRDRLFAASADLAKEAGLSRTAKVLFRFDDWQHPRADTPVSRSPDLVAMARALAHGEALDHLPGKANGDLRRWLDLILPSRQAEDESAWGGAPPSSGSPPATPKVGGEATKAPRQGAANKKATTAPPQVKAKSAVTAVSPKTAHERSSAAPSWLNTTVHPAWDNWGTPSGAIRASSFSTPSGPVLVLEALVASRSEKDVRREIMGYGPGVPNAPAYGLMGPSDIVVDKAQIYEGDRSRVARGEILKVKIGGRSLAVPMTVPPLRGAKLKNEKSLDRLLPAQVLLYRLPELLDRDALFAGAAAIKRKLGLPAEAKLLFQADDFFQVAQSQPLLKSPDLVALAQAAAEGRAPETLPGPPNGNLQAWLDKILSQLRASDAREWPG